MSLRSPPAREPAPKSKKPQAWRLLDCIKLLPAICLGAIVVVVAIAAPSDDPKSQLHLASYGEWTVTSFRQNRGFSVYQSSCDSEDCIEQNTMSVSCSFVNGANNQFGFNIGLGANTSARLPEYDGSVVSVPFKNSFMRRYSRPDIIDFRLYSGDTV